MTRSPQRPLRPIAWRAAGIVLVGLFVVAPADAGMGRKLKEITKNAALTGGHAARDGALTFGRATRDFFTKGPSAAKRTWKANAARTKVNAKAGGRATRRAAESD